MSAATSDEGTPTYLSSSEPLLATDRVLWSILFLSTALKLLLAVVLDRQPAVLDEVAYLDLAKGITANGQFEGTFRPPFYPAFMSAFLSLGLGTLGIRIMQCLLSALSILLVYRIAHLNFGQRAARFAAGIFAFDPVLIAFSHRLWSETLFILLLLITIDRLTSAVRSGRWLPWIVGGVALGLAGLTRPMILTFAPLLLPWAILQAGRTSADQRRHARTWQPVLMRFAVFTLVTCCVVFPWTLRNYRLAGALILVDTNGPFNILVGTQRESAFVDKDDLWSERFGRVAGERYEEFVLREPARAQELASEQARRNIADHPALFLKKSFWEAGHLWTLDSFLLRHLRNGWYGPTARQWVMPLLAPLTALFFALLVISGFLGLAAAAPSPLRGLGLLLIAHSTLLFGLTYALSRYALPLHAVLALFAGAALSDRRSTWARIRAEPGHRKRELALVCAFALLAVAWVRDLPLLHDMVVNGGAEHRFRYERVEASAPSSPGALR